MLGPGELVNDSAECAPEDDAAVFERMVGPETGFLFALARGHLPIADLAHDAVQETILKAWEHRKDLKNPASFRSWLGSILIRTCHTMRRKLKVEQQAAAQLSLTLSTHQPAKEDERAERLAAVAEAFKRLDEQDQVVLALKYSKG